MASEGLRGKERKHHSCEFVSGLQVSPWRPQIFGLVEAHRAARLATHFDRITTGPAQRIFEPFLPPKFGDMLPAQFGGCFLESCPSTPRRRRVPPNYACGRHKI
jgi:hypothetical protein